MIALKTQTIGDQNQIVTKDDDTIQMNVRVPKHLKAWVAKKAQKDRRSLNSTIIFILEELKEKELEKEKLEAVKE